MRHRHFDQLLLELYRCPTERHRWPDTLDRVCSATGARSAVIQVIVRGNITMRARRLMRDSASTADAAAHDRFMSDDVNPRMKAYRFAGMSAGLHVLRDEAIFRSGERDLLELQDRLASIQLGKFMGLTVPHARDEHIAFVLHRDVRDGREFGPDQEMLARALAPHLSQVVRLSDALDRTAATVTELHAAIDRMQCCLALCDDSGSVLWTNRSAQELLENNAFLHCRQQRLQATSFEDQSRLARAFSEVAGAADGTGQQLHVLGRDRTAPVQLLLHPVRCADPATGTHQTRVLVLLSSSQAAPPFQAGLVRELFGLSPAESRLATALCSGKTVENYACEAGVTIGTARFQLKQVLAKARVSRQSELVRTLCSSVLAQIRA